MGGFLNFLREFANNPQLNPAKAGQKDLGALPDASLALPGDKMQAGPGLEVASPEGLANTQHRAALQQLLAQMANKDHPESIERRRRDEIDRVYPEHMRQMMREIDQAPILAGDPGGPLSKISKLPATTKLTQRASDAFTKVTDANREQILSAALKAAEEFGGLNRELLQRRLGLYAPDADGILDTLVKSQKLGQPNAGLGGLAPHVASAEGGLEGLAQKISNTLTQLQSGKIGRLRQEAPAINRGSQLREVDRGATLQTPVREDLGVTMNKSTGRAQLLGPGAKKVGDLGEAERLSLILNKEMNGIPLTREDQLFLAARQPKP